MLGLSVVELARNSFGCGSSSVCAFETLDEQDVQLVLSSLVRLCAIIPKTLQGVLALLRGTRKVHVCYIIDIHNKTKVDAGPALALFSSEVSIAD